MTGGCRDFPDTNARPPVRRNLGAMESTQALANELFAYNGVGVLRLRNGPSPEALREALSHLRRRHARLRLFWDILFLDSDISPSLARVIGEEISGLLDVMKV